MCHAMNSRGQACRRHGWIIKRKLTTIEPIPETFDTGLCVLHNRILDDTGTIALWRTHHTDTVGMPLMRVFARAASEDE